MNNYTFSDIGEREGGGGVRSPCIEMFSYSVKSLCIEILRCLVTV